MNLASFTLQGYPEVQRLCYAQGMRLPILSYLAAIALGAPAQADPYCDALMSFVHDAPHNAIPTVNVTDPAGSQTVAQHALPGARCLVSPYNPTDLAGQPAEQSVYCFWSASDEAYPNLFASTNARVATCMGQDVQNASFATRIEYHSNYGSVRISADQMTNDWAIAVTVMPLN
jgi:hypothetical protein